MFDKGGVNTSVQLERMFLVYFVSGRCLYLNLKLTVVSSRFFLSAHALTARVLNLPSTNLLTVTPLMSPPSLSVFILSPNVVFGNIVFCLQGKVLQKVFSSLKSFLKTSSWRTLNSPLGVTYSSSVSVSVERARAGVPQVCVTARDTLVKGAQRLRLKLQGKVYRQQQNASAFTFFQLFSRLARDYGRSPRDVVWTTSSGRADRLHALHPRFVND